VTLLLTAPERARPRPVLDLAGHGARTALRTATGEVSYAELAERAGDLASDVLAGTRRLVLVEGANRPESVVAYLAALQHGHVALLVPDGRPEAREQLVAAYDPDVVLHADGAATVRRDDSAHALHPDLALLLSTSGSTGSPKLVRLSHDNVRSNAESIATYLRLSAADRAATSLPLHYCYGLSVVNSHLASGAGLVLTDGSVVDECFWDLFHDAGATSFAGVPYTFDLLDRSGFADRHLPTLRTVTQAGGRMDPGTVRRYAALGERSGWDLVVMYGQTEATARMAWLPPELAASRPEAIGVPVPGGSIRIDPVPEGTDDGVGGGVGEIVYRGPNVMMGYAEEPADLALPASVEELRTGDLGREVDGLFEVVGRRDRHAKVFGLRLDLDRVEREVGARGAPVRCVAVGDVLHAFTTRARASDAVREAVATLCGLPHGAVRVHHLAAFPTTATGKPDHGALTHQARLSEDAEPRSRTPRRHGPHRAPTAEAVRDQLALVLGRPDARVDSSFVTLGGDSLSFVELAGRLGDLLGDLPPGWHTLTAAELADRARPPRRGTPVDTSVALRALGILLIVATHANLTTVVGGAHLLLAVAGFNLARFQLADLPRRTRLRHTLASVVQVVVPSTLFIAAVGLTTGMYDPATALFLNGLLGSDTWTVQWQFWFLEALVWLTLATAALLAVPALDRLERRAPYAVALGLLGATLALRYAWTGIETGPTERYTPALVAWFVAAGWAAARATTLPRRLLVVAVTAVGLAGYFGDTQRELVVLAGVAVLTLVPSVRLPRVLASAAGVVAGASLFIYLTHWQVYPHLEMEHPLLATLLSLAVGIGYARAVRPGSVGLGRLLRTTRTP
jgi:acyl-CoA synthetase (AMP-forming)/AMP-acid ligase II